MSKIYLAIEISGSHEDYRECVVFATEVESTADDWVNRYNKLIAIKKGMIKGFQVEDGKPVPFLYWLVEYEDPSAEVIEIDIR